MSSVYIVVNNRRCRIGSDSQLCTSVILPGGRQITRFQHPTNDRDFIIRLLTLCRGRQGFLEWLRRCVIRFTAEVGAVFVEDEW